jgi:hypothetical protein
MLVNAIHLEQMPKVQMIPPAATFLEKKRQIAKEVQRYQSL